MVTFTNNRNITYIYDATGVKLKKVITQSATSINTEYAGGIIYENGVLEMIPQPEGYIQPGVNGGYDYVYQYKDHLGNVRLSYADTDNNGSIDASTEIISEKSYYPFGLEHKGYNNVVQNSNSAASKFKYNGKELNDELGLDWYDYGARNYDASLGRWMNVDPLAEKFPNMSPYAAFNNNPIYFIDPDGRAAIPADWPPKWWTSNVNKWNRLNNKEKNIIRWDPQFYKAFDIETNADAATTMTTSTFGGNGKGDESDAFRHAYWQALNTQDVGENFTEKWSDAHEYSTPTNEVTTDLYMDIHNNNVGIEVGKNNPDATPDELKTIILDRIKKGDLLIINSNNKLIKSDGGIIKDNSEIRRYDTSKKIATEILKDPKGQKTKDYE